MTITLNHRKESLARACIQAIAGHCGMTCSCADFDYGIDVQVHDVVTRQDNGKPRYVESGFDIAIQAKSTTAATLEDDHVVYDLEVKNYHDLRETNVGTPRILVLLVLPKDEADWVNLSEEQLILRQCVYWVSLKGEPDTSNEEKIRIRIPRSNLLTPDALNALMVRRKEGDEL